MAEVRIEPWHRLLVVDSDAGPSRGGVELAAEVGALSMDSRPFQALVLGSGAAGEAIASRLLVLGARRVAVVGAGLDDHDSAVRASFATEGEARAWLKGTPA